MGYLVGSCDPRFLKVPRNWCVDFLPYLGDYVEPIIGYPNPNRGYGYGTWAEFFEGEAEARARFEFLKSCGVVERAELLKGPRGALVDLFEER